MPAQIARSKVSADRLRMAEYLDSQAITPATYVELLEKGQKKDVEELLEGLITKSSQYLEICSDASEDSALRKQANMLVLQVWKESISAWAGSVMQAPGMRQMRVVIDRLTRPRRPACSCYWL